MRTALIVTVLLGACALPQEHPEPVTNTYVISALRIDAPDGDRAVGFDLDGVTSTGEGAGCIDRVADFRSPDEPIREGIDNQLAAVVEAIAMLTPTCADTEGTECLAENLTRAITEHPTLWLIEVAEIHSYLADDHVEVTVFRASFTAPPVLVDGRLARGQTFHGEAVARDLDARIVDGRLDATLDAPVPFVLALDEVEGTPFPLERARISIAQMHPLGLSGAVIGGAVPLRSIVEMICPPIDCDPAGPGFFDLDPSPDDSSRCDGVSAALTFDAVAAQRAAP
jgi:hypothetical protein